MIADIAGASCVGTRARRASRSSVTGRWPPGSATPTGDFTVGAWLDARDGLEARQLSWAVVMMAKSVSRTICPTGTTPRYPRLAP
jgi:hypothetical protein